MIEAPLVNDTMRKFGYPDTLVAEYDRWVVLLRPRQATLGALVLACREPATAFGQVSAAAFGELGKIVGSIEATLARVFAYDRINYLMLMMVDREVHFHVLPRYARDREFAGAMFVDAGWPQAPELAGATELTAEARGRLLDALRGQWTP